MYHGLLRAELSKQEEVYLALKEGRRETVCYKAYQDEVYGTQDANYTNRLRLAYYLLYWKVDDEEAIAWLFGEELKDREENSFQGIGTVLEVLTFLLKKYNAGHRYDDLFVRAKNANFDCACGYDPDMAGVPDLTDNNLLDCIYLCQDMEFRAVMEPLVEQWRASVAEWGDSERTTLIRFYSFLGQEAKNEVLYLEQLALAEQAGKTVDVVRAYSNLIRHYLDMGNNRMAHRYLDEVKKMAECPEVRRLRLMGDLLEEAFEVVCGEQGKAGVCCTEAEVQEEEKTKQLWEWARAELAARTNRYGNLYQKGIAAAKAMGDSYAGQLEKEYKVWWEDCRIK